MAGHLVAVPALSRTNEENPRDVPDLAKRLILVSIPLGILAILVLAFSADTIVQILLGSKFAQTGDVLTVLSGVLGARFITLAAASVLIAVGWQRQRIRPQLIIAGLNVGLNLLIIPRWGIMGAAWRIRPDGMASCRRLSRPGTAVGLNRFRLELRW